MMHRIDDIWSDSTIIQIQTVADTLIIRFKRYDDSTIMIKFNTLIGLQIKPTWRNPEQIEGILILDASNNLPGFMADMIKNNEEVIDDLKVYQIIDSEPSTLVEIIAKGYTIELG